MKLHNHFSIALAIILLFFTILPGCSKSIPAETTIPVVPGETSAPDVTVYDENTITLRILADVPHHPFHAEGEYVTLPNTGIAAPKMYTSLQRILESIAISSTEGPIPYRIELDFLDQATDARAYELNKIRQQIAEGSGPDIFLFTRIQPQITGSNNRASIICEPLFDDVISAMAEGYFADLTEFYDADTKLNKDGFVSGVMEAGVLDGRRYVLPLRYNFPVAYVDMDQFAETGLSTDIFSAGGHQLLQTLTENGIPLCFDYGENPLRFQALHFLPEELTAEALADYLALYQSLQPIEDRQTKLWTLTRENKSYYEYYWATEPSDTYCIQLDSLESAVEQLAVAKLAGINLGMFPITQADGTLTADITMYGAVNANCAYPEAAYDLLSSLLTADSQHEKIIAELGHTYLMADGYPVLTEGSAQGIFNLINSIQQDTKLQKAANKMVITDADIPLLSLEVEARFPTWAEAELNKMLQWISIRKPEEVDTFCKEWAENYQNSYAP